MAAPKHFISVPLNKKLLYLFMARFGPEALLKKLYIFREVFFHPPSNLCFLTFFCVTTIGASCTKDLQTLPPPTRLVFHTGQQYIRTRCPGTPQPHSSRFPTFHLQRQADMRFKTSTYFIYCFALLLTIIGSATCQDSTNPIGAVTSEFNPDTGAWTASVEVSEQ